MAGVKSDIEEEMMLVEEATATLDNLNGLMDEQSDSLGGICEDAIEVIGKYQKLSRDAVRMLVLLRVELNYALETFEDNCKCGDCGPCERQKKFKSVLKREKKMWGRLHEAF